MLLRENRLDDAIRVIKEAFIDLLHSSGSSLCHVSDITHGCANLISSGVLSSEDQEKIECTTSTVFAFFPRAFTLLYECPEDLIISDVLIVLAYNLALSSHIKFLKTGKMCQHRLNQVLSYYQNGLEIAREFLTTADTVRMLPIQLALVNNQGHAFSHGQWLTETRDNVVMLTRLLSVFPYASDYEAFHGSEVFFDSACIFLHRCEFLYLAPAA